LKLLGVEPQLNIGTFVPSNDSSNDSVYHVPTNSNDSPYQPESNIEPTDSPPYHVPTNSNDSNDVKIVKLDEKPANE
jgi:hypothetical protein